MTQPIIKTELLQTVENLSSKIIIHGKLTEITTNQNYSVINPTSLILIGKLSICTVQEINAATNAAKLAQPSWAKMPSSKRGQLIQKCAQVLSDNSTLLAHIMSLETGKALKTESRVEA